MLIDKSGWQSFQLSWSRGSCDVFGFLESKNVQLMITETSISEIQHQTYCPNLFAGEHVVQGVSSSGITCGFGASEQSFALSSSNAALTTLNVDPYGFPVGIFHDYEILKHFSSLDATPHRKHLSFSDVSVVFAAKELAKVGRRFFVLVNDKHLFAQLKLEGHRVLKGAQLLHWMQNSGFISSQKSRRIYEEWGRYDPGSVKKDTTFGQLFPG